MEKREDRIHEMSEEEKRILDFEDKLLQQNEKFLESKFENILRKVIGEHESNFKRLNNLDVQFFGIPIGGRMIYCFPILVILLFVIFEIL